MPELVKIVGGLETAGEGFEVTKERIETSTAAGRLVLHVFAALAEFKRRLIGGGTVAGPSATQILGEGGLAVTEIWHVCHLQADVSSVCLRLNLLKRPVCSILVAALWHGSVEVYKQMERETANGTA